MPELKTFDYSSILDRVTSNPAYHDHEGKYVVELNLLGGENGNCIEVIQKRQNVFHPHIWFRGSGATSR